MDIINRVSDYLQKFVNDKMVIFDDEQRKSNQVVNKVKESLIYELKKDPLFKDLYQTIQHAGSSYIGLKITRPNEFDFNMVLTLPFAKSFLKIVTSDPVEPSFAMVGLTQPFEHVLLSNHLKKEVHEKMKSWFDSDGYLLIDPVNNWLIGLIDSVLSMNPTLNILNVYQISRSTSDRATTLKLKIFIRDGSTKYIDMDFVPVFKFTKQQSWPKIRPLDFLEIDECFLYWFMVPKKVKLLPNCESVINPNIMWRMDFPDIEKHIIDNAGCARFIILLLKLLRDTLNLNIASYFLKTLVMHEILDKPYQYWSQKNMGSLLIQALKDFSKRLADQNIPFLFNKQENLLQGRVEDGTMRHIRFRIDNVVEKIGQTPNYIRAFYYD